MPGDDNSVPPTSDSVPSSADCLLGHRWTGRNGLPRVGYKVPAFRDSVPAAGYPMPATADQMPAGDDGMRTFGSGYGLPADGNQLQRFADSDALPAI